MKEALKAFRVKAGLTQEEVAAALGLRQNTISMWEAGVNTPRAALIPKIAALYKCSIAELYGSNDGDAVTMTQ